LDHSSGAAHGAIHLEPTLDAERRQCGSFRPFKRTELSAYFVPIVAVPGLAGTLVHKLIEDEALSRLSNLLDLYQCVSAAFCFKSIRRLVEMNVKHSKH
jgi:hypothetical protein